jgi:hypothetical protein
MFWEDSPLELVIQTHSTQVEVAPRTEIQKKSQVFQYLESYRTVCTSFLSCFIGLSILSFLHFRFASSFYTLISAPSYSKINENEIENSSPPLLLASFGAACVLLFGQIESPLAQPRNAFLGQIISAIIGVSVKKLFLACQVGHLIWLQCSLSVSLGFPYIPDCSVDKRVSFSHRCHAAHANDSPPWWSHSAGRCVWRWVSKLLSLSINELQPHFCIREGHLQSRLLLCAHTRRGRNTYVARSDSRSAEPGFSAKIPHVLVEPLVRLPLSHRRGIFLARKSGCSMACVHLRFTFCVCMLIFIHNYCTWRLFTSF